MYITMMVSNIKAVLSSFFGVRKRSDLEKDMENLKPWQVFFTGVAVATTFVLVIIFIVNHIV